MEDARLVEGEWLDELPADDPDAMRSRRDLRRLNAWMFQVNIMERLVARIEGPDTPRVIVDLGAGDGTFLLGLARRMAPGWRGSRAILIDRQDLVTAETFAGFDALNWSVEVVAADALAYLYQARTNGADLVISNLFLHHFGEDDLATILEQVARITPRFAACEPLRSPMALAGSRLLRMLGCNRVTRHDAVTSVRAGFRGSELSWLWPAKGGWHVDEYRAGPFTQCFAACQNG